MNQHVLFLGFKRAALFGHVMLLATSVSPKAGDGIPADGGCRVHTQSCQFGTWGAHG